MGSFSAGWMPLLFLTAVLFPPSGRLWLILVSVGGVLGALAAVALIGVIIYKVKRWVSSTGNYTMKDKLDELGKV